MSGAPRILFVADAGAKIGGGHVMRCLTLAEALTIAGAACAFAATPAAAALLHAFGRAPIEVIPLAEALSARELAEGAAEAAKSREAEIVVADHYGFGAQEEALLAATAPRLLILDDLRRRHAAGVVLDPGLGRTGRDYPGREVLGGPQYALVRPEFTAARQQALARRARQEPPSRVLVSLGLGDAGAITARVVQALAAAPAGLALDVVIGGEAASRGELEALARGGAPIALHIDTREVAALMAGADMAVGAGGSSVWERAVLGLPSLTVVLADNQRENASALANAGATLAVAPPSGDFERRLRAAFSVLAADADVRAGMSEAAAALCDGLGAQRVAARLLAA